MNARPCPMNQRQLFQVAGARAVPARSSFAPKRELESSGRFPLGARAATRDRSRAGAGAATVAALLLLASAVSAQNLVVSRPTFSAGGAVVTNGTLRAAVTIGQPLASPRAVAGTLALESGFWTRGGAGQTEGAPPLRASRAGDNLVLAWTAAPAGLRLQVADYLGATANWRTVVEAATLAGGDNPVPNPPCCRGCASTASCARRHCLEPERSCSTTSLRCTRAPGACG